MSPQTAPRAAGLLRTYFAEHFAPARALYGRLRLLQQWYVPRAPRRATPLAFAALVILAAGLVGRFVPLGAPSATYSTATAETREVQLEDGTRIDLAPQTTLRVQLLERFRLLSLVTGEVRVRAVHDARRPLDLLAGDCLIRDLGTTFSARRWPGSATTVLVTEGEVLLLPSSARTRRSTPDGLTVHAGELAEWTGPQTPRVRALSEQGQADRLAWLSHKASFSDTPLQDAVREINRFNTVRIVIDDPAIANVAINGVFTPTHPDRFVEALQNLGIERKRSSGEDVAKSGEIHLIAGARAPPP
jgi:transmembrane sensor